MGWSAGGRERPGGRISQRWAAGCVLEFLAPSGGRHVQVDRWLEGGSASIPDSPGGTSRSPHPARPGSLPLPHLTWGGQVSPPASSLPKHRHLSLGLGGRGPSISQILGGWVREGDTGFPPEAGGRETPGSSWHLSCGGTHSREPPPRPPARTLAERIVGAASLHCANASGYRCVCGEGGAHTPPPPFVHTTLHSPVTTQPRRTAASNQPSDCGSESPRPSPARLCGLGPVISASASACSCACLWADSPVSALVLPGPHWSPELPTRGQQSRFSAPPAGP